MGERFTAVSQKVLTDFFMTKGRQDHTNNQKSIRKTQSQKLTPRTTAEAAGVIWVQKENWSRKKDGQKEPDYQTTICCVVSVSPVLKEASITESTHLVSATQTKRTVTLRLRQKKKNKPWKTLGHLPRKGEWGAAELHSAPRDPLTRQWKGETPLAKTLIHTHWTEAICLASHHKPQICICPRNWERSW